MPDVQGIVPEEEVGGLVGKLKRASSGITTGNIVAGGLADMVTHDLMPVIPHIPTSPIIEQAHRRREKFKSLAHNMQSALGIESHKVDMDIVKSDTLMPYATPLCVAIWEPGKTWTDHRVRLGYTDDQSFEPGAEMNIPILESSLSKQSPSKQTRTADNLPKSPAKSPTRSRIEVKPVPRSIYLRSIPMKRRGKRGLFSVVGVRVPSYLPVSANHEQLYTCLEWVKTFTGQDNIIRQESLQVKEEEIGETDVRVYPLHDLHVNAMLLSVCGGIIEEAQVEQHLIVRESLARGLSDTLQRGMSSTIRGVSKASSRQSGSPKGGSPKGSPKGASKSSNMLGGKSPKPKEEKHNSLQAGEHNPMHEGDQDPTYEAEHNSIDNVAEGGEQNEDEQIQKEGEQTVMIDDFDFTASPHSPKRLILNRTAQEVRPIERNGVDADHASPSKRGQTQHEVHAQNDVQPQNDVQTRTDMHPAAAMTGEKTSTARIPSKGDACRSRTTSYGSSYVMPPDSVTGQAYPVTGKKIDKTSLLKGLKRSDADRIGDIMSPKSLDGRHEAHLPSVNDARHAVSQVSREVVQGKQVLQRNSMKGVRYMVNHRLVNRLGSSLKFRGGKSAFYGTLEKGLDYLPLPETTKKRIKNGLQVLSLTQSYETVDLIQDQFGDAIGFFFAFETHYVHCLWYLAIPAMMQFLWEIWYEAAEPEAYEYVKKPKLTFVYCIAVLFWGHYILSKWERREAKFYKRWGRSQVPLDPGRRPGFKPWHGCSRKKKGDPDYYPPWARLARTLFVLPFILIQFLLAQAVLVFVFWMQLWVIYEWGGCTETNDQHKREKGPDAEEICTSASYNKGLVGFILEIIPDILEAAAFAGILELSKIFGKFLVKFQNWRTSKQQNSAYVQQVFAMEFVGKVGWFSILAFYFVPDWGFNEEGCDQSWDYALWGQNSLTCIQSRVSYSRRVDMMTGACVSPFVISQVVNIAIKRLVPRLISAQSEWVSSYEGRMRSWDENSGNSIEEISREELRKEIRNNPPRAMNGNPIVSPKSGANTLNESVTKQISNGSKGSPSAATLSKKRATMPCHCCMRQDRRINSRRKCCYNIAQRFLICACVVEEDDVGGCLDFIFCGNARVEEIEEVVYMDDDGVLFKARDTIGSNVNGDDVKTAVNETVGQTAIQIVGHLMNDPPVHPLMGGDPKNKRLVGHYPDCRMHKFAKTCEMVDGEVSEHSGDKSHENPASVAESGMAVGNQPGNQAAEPPETDKAGLKPKRPESQRWTRGIAPFCSGDAYFDEQWRPYFTVPTTEVPLPWTELVPTLNNIAKRILNMQRFSRNSMNSIGKNGVGLNSGLRKTGRASQGGKTVSLNKSTDSTDTNKTTEPNVDTVGKNNIDAPSPTRTDTMPNVASGRALMDASSALGKKSIKLRKSGTFQDENPTSPVDSAIVPIGNNMDQIATVVDVYNVDSRIVVEQEGTLPVVASSSLNKLKSVRRSTQGTPAREGAHSSCCAESTHDTNEEVRLDGLHANEGLRLEGLHLEGAHSANESKDREIHLDDEKEGHLVGNRETNIPTSGEPSFDIVIADSPKSPDSGAGKSSADVRSPTRLAPEKPAKTGNSQTYSAASRQSGSTILAPPRPSVGGPPGSASTPNPGQRAYLESVLLEIEKQPFNIFDEELEILLHFVWLLSFSMVWPAGVLISIAIWIIEGITDTYKLTNIKRRPFPESGSDCVDSIKPIFAFICYWSIFCNAAMLILPYRLLQHRQFAVYDVDADLESYWREACLVVLVSHQIAFMLLHMVCSFVTMDLPPVRERKIEEIANPLDNDAIEAFIRNKKAEGSFAVEKKKSQ